MDDEIRVNKPVRIIPQKPPLKPGKKKEQEEHKDEVGRPLSAIIQGC
jgi:hypothetical protein